MKRDLDEVLASQAAMIRRRSQGGAETPEALVRAWRDHLVHVRTVMELRPDFRVLELWYHEVIADPAAAARRIAAFLERPLDVEAMARAVNPSLYRNRLVDRTGDRSTGPPRPQ